MKWEDIHWGREVWSVRDPKNREPYEVQLLDVAIKTLRRRRDENPDSDTFVFPSPSKRGHLRDVPQKPWRTFLKHAALKDFHWHDIRHTHASWMVIAGVPLLHVKSALGHSSLQSTQRYAHLIGEVVRDARETGRTKMLEMVSAAKKRAKLANRKPKLLKAAVPAKAGVKPVILS
jgi:integrase